jgi:outer membrane protein insertion porin family
MFRRASYFKLLSVVLLLAGSAPRASARQGAAPRLVEAVELQGNRRLRDEDVLYYAQTRPGDQFNQAQVERDLQAILALGFFEKTAARVATQVGPRGGVIVIFYVKELPIIRALEFKGLKSVAESDVLKAFRENRVGISKEAIYDPVKARHATRVIRELLAARGHPNATIEIEEEEVSPTSTGITFRVDEGERVRVVEVQFEGNRAFSDRELRAHMKYVREAGLISRFQGTDILDRRKLDEDLRLVTFYMRSKGYLQARTGEPRVEELGPRRTGFALPVPLISSVDDGLRVTVPVVEGRVYRVGDIKIEGNSIFPEKTIRAVIGLKPGDIADGERIGKVLYEELKKLYGSQGFIQYTAEPEPSFRDDHRDPNTGLVDFTITIDEGKQFTLRRLEFVGNTFTRDDVLRREMLLNEGDIFNQAAFELSILRLNQLGYFDPIDKEKDADYRTNEEEALVDANIKVTERGRQQISFNGGAGGTTGSFFGLEYSTNNLLGRGESLSFNLAAGNRQNSFVFSFTEPYIRNRPITAGFSLYAQSLKFFGEGTLISQNQEALAGLLGTLTGNLSVSEENLFTQKTAGLSLFASAPLSEFYRKRQFTQFSRLGLSYSLSRTSVEDPEVNQQNNAQTFIPVIYRQSNILTSRVTPTFVYDTRNGAVDPTMGRQLSISLGLAGLGGDVRTYQPSFSYSQFIPVRRKDSKNPEVFAFRVLAAHIGNMGVSSRVREAQANSLSFINGTPVYERFFLGDEYTIRGYNTRSISPIAPVDIYVTSRNVTVATNASGTPEAVTGLSQAFINQLVNLGTFTGASGANSVRVARTFTATGADTQLLGNFEYRIPLFGPVALAAFADIGAAFNLRRASDQSYSSNFLDDQPFLESSFGTGFNLNTLAVAANPQLARSGSGGLIIRDQALVTQEEYNNALRLGPVDPITGLPAGFQQIFLRGQAQTNTVVRLSESLFSGLKDYRASLGLELRVQVPVINVPFRLIYAYNPRARRGVYDPGIVFDERKSVFRFSIGRTF